MEQHKVHAEPPCMRRALRRRQLLSQATGYGCGYSWHHTEIQIRAQRQILSSSMRIHFVQRHSALCIFIGGLLGLQSRWQNA